MAADPRRHHRLPFGDEPLFYAVALVIVATVLFLVAPGLDIAFSRLFGEAGHGFPLAGTPLIEGIRSLSDTAMKLVVVVLIAVLAIKLARVDRPSLIPPNITLFLLSTLALGPGLLVNGILKDNWGRPRPRSIDFFGGQLPYVRVWDIFSGYAGNHSFVSGEASSAIWLTAIALVVPADFRLPVLAVTVPFALAASLGRIAAGGHFLSDVLISWGLTLCIIFIMHRLLIERPPAALAEARLEAGLTRLGQQLRDGRKQLVARIRERSGK